MPPSWPPNSANGLIPSLTAWAKSQPPGNVAIVSKIGGESRAALPDRRPRSPLPRVPGTPYLTAWSNSGKSGRERALRLMAIRQARLEPLALSVSGRERMFNGWAAASEEKRTDFSARVAWFGDILIVAMRRHGAKNADYRGGVTCLDDTQLPSACLHASESGGRSRPEAVRGMPDVPIAPPATGPPEGWAAVGFVSPASLQQGVVGAFAQGFGLFSSDFGVGMSQDLGY